MHQLRLNEDAAFLNERSTLAGDLPRYGQTTSEETQMDALALLKEDHVKAKKLMAELEETTERGVKTREQKWTKLLKDLTIHENIEEEIFYPALIEHPKAKDIVLEAMEEHHLVDDIVEQLKDTPFDDEHWAAKFKVTKENVEHHIEEEETEMFKVARQVFSKEELDELGSRLEATKAEQMQDAMPERDQIEL
jgi:hemerythrin-like domain-containing protein